MSEQSAVEVDLDGVFGGTNDRVAEDLKTETVDGRYLGIDDVNAVDVLENFGKFGHAAAMIEPDIANGGHKAFASLDTSYCISSITSLCG